MNDIMKGEMRMNTRQLQLTLGLVVAATIAHADLVASRSLVDLEKSADLIVVASASGTITAGPKASFTLGVVRVIRGDLALVGKNVPVVWAAASGVPGVSSQGAAVAATGTGLWFLQRTSDGWQLLPAMQGNVSLNDTFIPTPPTPILPTYAYEVTAALSDKVAAEVCAALEIAAGKYNSPQLLLQYGLLDQLNSAFSTILYQRMSTSASFPEKILGLSGLIRAGDPAALLAAAQLASQFEAYPSENAVLLWSIQNEFRSSEGVAALGPVAVDSTNQSFALRQATAHALGAIHTAPSLPYLATLLDDPNLTLQTEAIRGIAFFANGLPIQTASSVPTLGHMQFTGNAPYRNADTVANFVLGQQTIEQNMSRYQSFWKNWWSQHRSALGY
jgi:hypothetical protein